MSALFSLMADGGFGYGHMGGGGWGWSGRAGMIRVGPAWDRKLCSMALSSASFSRSLGNAAAKLGMSRG